MRCKNNRAPGQDLCKVSCCQVKLIYEFEQRNKIAGWTDGQTDMMKQIYISLYFVGRGYKNVPANNAAQNIGTIREQGYV